MPIPAQTLWLQQFKGKHDLISPGADPASTSSLSNMKFNFGSMSQRGGMTAWLDVAATISGPFIGLFHYPTMSGTNYAIRMNATTIEYLATGGPTWTDFTGTTLNGDANNRPQSTIIDDTFIFTNEGKDHPQKWEGPTNLAVVIGNGSTPPYCKAIEAYLGFLMAGNISDNASFTDLFDGPRSIRYADDWDNDWTGCVGNEIVLNETPGQLLAMKVLGRDLICYKEDGIVRVRWVGGQLRFTQEKMQFSGGILAPLSVQSISDQAHIFLGIDGVLYLLQPNGVEALSNDEFADTLPPLITNGYLKYARSFIDTNLSTYYLFYPSTTSVDLDRFVSYNWRDKAFSSGTIATGVDIQSVVEHRPTNSSTPVLLVASDNLIAVFGSSSVDKDLGISVSKFYSTNWQGLGEEGYFYGARLIFKLYDRVTNTDA